MSAVCYHGCLYNTDKGRGVSLKTSDKNNHTMLWHEFAVKYIQGSHKIPIITGY